MKIEEAKKQWEKLPNRVKSILLGTVYGKTTVKNDKILIEESRKQAEYLKWKREAIKAWIPAEKETEKGYESQALPSLIYLNQLTHKRGIKTVKRSTLNQMTALSLAVWWQDAGSLVSKGRQGIIRTEEYTEREVKKIVTYMEVEWGIGMKAYKGQTTEQWRVTFKTLGELEKFIRLIMPYVEVKTMLYKIMIKYTEAERQQRWTSEILERTKFTREEVERVSTERTKETRNEGREERKEEREEEVSTEDDIVHSKEELKKREQEKLKTRRTLVIPAVNDETKMRKCQR